MPKNENGKQELEQNDFIVKEINKHNTILNKKCCAYAITAAASLVLNGSLIFREIPVINEHYPFLTAGAIISTLLYFKSTFDMSKESQVVSNLKLKQEICQISESDDQEHSKVRDYIVKKINKKKKSKKLDAVLTLINALISLISLYMSIVFLNETFHAFLNSMAYIFVSNTILFGNMANSDAKEIEKLQFLQDHEESGKRVRKINN